MIDNAQQTIEQLTNPQYQPTQAELEACPNIAQFETELQQLQERLAGLNQLEALLAPIKKKETILDENIAQLALQLQVNDAPPSPPPRGPGKKKGPREQNKTRKPYRRYFSRDQVEIRVGKQATDNDELSLNPQHRDGSDWWMHASGCPGSHVVIRSQQPSEDTIQDAACLAAQQSKCHGQIIPVSLTQCRNISKPPGAKAGLVQLSGTVRTVRVNMKEAQPRLNRLEETVLVN